MNIRERIIKEKERVPNSKTINVNFTHEQVYKILKKLRLSDDIEFIEFTKKVTEKICYK
jgi:hypothetical protein